MSVAQRFILPLLTAGALTLSASISAEEEVIATVNGSKITQQDFQRFVYEATQGKGGEINPNDVLSELLSRELVYQDAVKQGIDKRKIINDELQRFKQRLMVAAALDDQMKKKPTTDKELQAIYDKDIKNLKLKEFKARHILVEDKTLAEQIITELDLGGDFEKLAKKHSIDAGSQKNGGDLGWFKPQQMVPEFSLAAAQLEKNKYTKAPVKSQFGWHIIKMEDNRDVAPPTFEQIKPKLAQVAQQQKVTKYIQSLKEKADIKINQKK
ncbi:MAG: peptidylprolyl isomerase [Pseudomonadota bacterium]